MDATVQSSVAIGDTTTGDSGYNWTTPIAELVTYLEKFTSNATDIQVTESYNNTTQVTESYNNTTQVTESYNNTTQTSDNTTVPDSSSSSPGTDRSGDDLIRITSSNTFQSSSTTQRGVTTEVPPTPTVSVSSSHPDPTQTPPTSTVTSDSVSGSTNGSDFTTQGMTPSGLSQGAIIGISVTASILIVVVVIVLILVCRNKKKDKRKKYHGDDNVNDYKLDLHPVSMDPGKIETSSVPSSKPSTIHFDKKLTDQTNVGIERGLDNSAIDVEVSPSRTDDGAGMNGMTDVLRWKDRGGPDKRVPLSDSRYSLGPLMLGEDGPVSSSEVYNAMYSTNTFK